ncbi:hypothetical protein [Clostridium perfringens]|uniref:hypothetical protein n=1 Tax=Clostridium perfringens TaxID=1502 RepID=UPI003D329CA8
MLVSNRFLRDTFYTTKYTKERNSIGQIIKKYSKDVDYKGNIQPIEEKAIKYTWGEDIKSKLQLFTDVDLAVTDLILYNNKSYAVEKIVNWKDYFIYAILESDVTVYDS